MTDDATLAGRGWFLTLMVILFLLRALSDFTKPLEFVYPTPTSGIVEFGHKFHNAWHTAILGAMFGVLRVLLLWFIEPARVGAADRDHIRVLRPFQRRSVQSQPQRGPVFDRVHRDLARGGAYWIDRDGDLSCLPSRAAELKRD